MITDPIKREQFRKKLEILINSLSLENYSDTPDFILANYLLTCFENFNIATKARNRWYEGFK